MKKLIFIFILLVLIAGISVVGMYLWYDNQINTKAGDSSQRVEIEIEKGESVKNIAVKLQKAGVIKSSDVFFIYVKLNNIAPSIQAGKFSIPQNLSIIEVTQTIEKAAGNDVWLTIPEGLRMDEIAEVLDTYFLKEENTKFDKNTFIDIFENPDNYTINANLLKYKGQNKSLEGFIFPDTYSVSKQITTKEIIELFINTLDERLQEQNLNLENHPQLKPYEVITLASIIEREARQSEERYMIADILLSRLNGELDGIKLLQVDATLLYEEKDWEAVVTNELKEKDSLYNTYKYIGLTPTPISNPGVDSIHAVLEPIANEYLFYLHDENGDIHYARTNNEHINNQRCFINKNSDYCL